METYLQGAETTLVDALSFAQPKVAEYILGRKQVSIPAAGGNQYGANGSRSCRFNITTSGPFIDLSTIAIKAVVKNVDPTPTPAGQPADAVVKASARPLEFLGPNMGTLLSSVKVSAGNVEIDRVEYYSRTEHTLSMLNGDQKRRQEFCEGFGLQTPAADTEATDYRSKSIAKGRSKTVVWRPKALGSLQTPMYLPTAFVSGGGVCIELTFASTGAEVCRSGYVAADNTEGEYTDRWECEGLQCMCDVVQVDPSFLTSLSSHLTGGGALTLHYKAYTSSLYSILAASSQLVHARANTRLASIMLSFTPRADTNAKKAVNRLYIPPVNALKMRCQIGENSYPDSPNASPAEFYHRLLHATGSANSAAHSPCITDTSFAADGFIAFQDFESCPHGAAATGVNTFNSQLSIQLEGIETSGTPDHLPAAAIITAYHDVALEISASGVVVAV